MHPWIHTFQQKRKIAKRTVLYAGVIFLFLLCGFFAFSHTAFAQTNDVFGVNQIQQNTVLTGLDIRIVITKIIRAVLGLLAILTLILVLYAGFTIMTSEGNEEKMAKGRKVLSNAVIGLAVILSAFAIVQFVINALTGTTGQGISNGGRPPSMPTFAGSGALGRVVKDHYPMRDQTDVARNTSIVITFIPPVDPESIILNTNNSCWGPDGKTPTTTSCAVDNNGKLLKPYYGDCTDQNGNGMVEWKKNAQGISECDTLNTSSIKMYKTVDEKKEEVPLVEAAAMTKYEDGGAFTFVLRPFEYLGSSLENTKYTVKLTDNITKLLDGDHVGIFSGMFSSFYSWNFETGVNLDFTPPHVLRVYPGNGDTIDKNIIIKVIFDEPVDPIMASGKVSSSTSLNDFSNLLLNFVPAGGVDTTVTGTWSMSNGYKTVEFISDNPCGLNSCGDTMYCLPVVCDSTTSTECQNPYQALIRTAETTGNPELPFEAMIFTGVYDLAFNALDNQDSQHHTKPGISSDPKKITLSEKATDNYWWDFSVRNKIDRSVPFIETLTPGIDQENIDETERISMQFSKIMWDYSLGTIKIDEYPANVCSNASFGANGELLTSCKDSEKLDDLGFVLRSEDTDENTTAIIKPARALGPYDLDLYYFPSVPSTAKGNNQNCMYPGRGPWSETKNESPTCNVEFDDAGNVSRIENCVGVTTVSSTDTGCVYTPNSGFESNNIRKSTIGECKNTLQQQDISPTEYGSSK